MSFPSSPNRFFHYSIREAPLSPEHNNAQIKILCPRTNRARPPLHYVNNSSGNFLRRFFAPSSDTNLPVRKMGVRALQLSVFILPPLSVRVLSFAPGQQGETGMEKKAPAVAAPCRCRNLPPSFPSIRDLGGRVADGRTGEKRERGCRSLFLAVQLAPLTPLSLKIEIKKKYREKGGGGIGGRRTGSNAGYARDGEGR